MANQQARQRQSPQQSGNALVHRRHARQAAPHDSQGYQTILKLQKDVVAGTCAKDAPGTVSAGPVRNAAMHALILSRSTAKGWESRPMSATAALTGTGARCRNASMTLSLPTMSIGQCSQRQGRASAFPRRTSGTSTAWSPRSSSKGSPSAISM